MIKNILVTQLKIGMFVHDLGVGWLDHSFVRSKFLLESDEDIARIAAIGVQTVEIDTGLGLDAPNAPTREEARAALDQEMRRVAAEPSQAATKVTVAEEMLRARGAVAHTHRIVQGVLADVRLGRAPQLVDIDAAVDSITQSVIRNNSAVLTLIRLRDKDHYTFHHSVAVGVMLVTFAQALGNDAEFVHDAGIGGLLHDIGKMRTPDAILKKPGRLSEDEFDIMRTHSAEGHRVLLETPGIGPIPLEITLLHHERIDGSGYPQKLSGDKIPLHARMASIVDVYDAITSERCYHEPVASTEALRKMLACCNQFDRSLLQSFIRCIGIYPVGSLVRLESDRLGVVVAQNDGEYMRPIVRVFFDIKRDHTIPLVDVDLAKAMGKGGADRIVSDESPAKWKLDTTKILFA